MHVGQVGDAVMHEQGVADAVLAQIGIGAGEGRAAHQRQAHRLLEAVIGILAVVEQGDAEIGFAEIDPAMHRGLEARLVPGGIAVGRALDVAELDFGADFGGVEVERELRLEHRSGVPASR